MKIALATISALCTLASTATAEDQQRSYGDLLRHFHVAAYASGLCPASDEIALYTFNATGRHPSWPATNMSWLTYSIVGLGEDGEVIALPEDQNQTLTNDFPAGQEAIKCVKSAAREQGAAYFAIHVVSVRLLQSE